MSEKPMLIKIMGKPHNTNTIQVYASTSDANANEVEEFYSDIEHVQ